MSAYPWHLLAEICLAMVAALALAGPTLWLLNHDHWPMWLSIGLALLWVLLAIPTGIWIGDNLGLVKN